MLRSSFPSRVALVVLAFGVGGCALLLDTEPLQQEQGAPTVGAGAAGAPAAGKGGGAGQGGEAGGPGGAGGEAGAGQGGVGGGQAGAAGGPEGCSISLACEDGDPCTLDQCLWDKKDCDEEDCLSQDGTPLGTCIRSPWNGTGMAPDFISGPLEFGKSLGQPVIRPVSGAFLIGVHKPETDDVILLRLDKGLQNTPKALLKNLLAAKGQGAFALRSSPAIQALPGGRALLLFGASNGSQSGLFGAVLDVSKLTLEAAPVALALDGYDAPSGKVVPQLFPSNASGNAWTIQWIGSDKKLRHVALSLEGITLTPSAPTKTTTTQGVESFAAVPGTGASWGALLQRGPLVEAWHATDNTSQLAGAPGVTQPAGISAASLADGLALAAYADGVPGGENAMYLRLLTCSNGGCSLGTLQGDLGAESSVGLYPALHAAPLGADPGVTQLAVSNMVYVGLDGGKLGSLGLLSVQRFTVSPSGSGVKVGEAPPVNPGFVVFPADLDDKTLAVMRTHTAASVAKDGQIGLAWLEGSESTTLHATRYSTFQCPLP